MVDKEPRDKQSHGSRRFNQTVELSHAISNKARLIILTGTDFGQVFRFSGEATIGRDRDADVRVDVLDVSRHHAKLWQLPTGQWFVKDLDSRNGTMINGVPAEEKQPLSFGDRIQIGGNLLFIFTHYDHLEEQVQQLQKMESIGQLASEVAHDFKNLLAAVINNVEYLSQALRTEEPPKDDIFDCLDEMKEAIERTVQLTERLLGFSRPAKQEAKPTNVADVVKEVIRLCRRTFPEEVSIETSVDEHLLVMGDNTQIHQALMNLCINARDAMPDGGSLLVEARTIKIDDIGLFSVPLPRPGEYVTVTITDSGTGMNDRIRRKAFEPFFSTKDPKKGTGLGLAMVYGIINNHGGRVHMDSEEGKGTTFHIYLPTLASSTDAHTTFRAPTADSEFQSTMANTILVADDEPGVRTALERVLKKLGYDVLLSGNGQEALRLYEEHSQEIKLVLLDVVMPNLGAEETFNILKTFDPSVRVLLTSGSVKPENVQHILEAGARGFLPKPFESKTLQEAINSAVKD